MLMRLPNRLKGLRDREKGFTLMELLVVVTIIAILAVFFFANLRRAIWKAKEGRTFEHLLTLRTSVQMFIAQKGPEYKVTLASVSTANTTNGNPYCVAEHPASPGGYDRPPPLGADWVGGDGDPDVFVVEKGRYQAYFTNFLHAIPLAQIVNNGDYQLGWGDGNFYASNGIWAVNYLPSGGAQPNGGAANGNWRGWFYRNTDGKFWINNTCLSTEGKRYDEY